MEYAIEYPTAGIATPEPALSGAEILRLRLRMTRSEGTRNNGVEKRFPMIEGEELANKKPRPAYCLALRVLCATISTGL